MAESEPKSTRVEPRNIEAEAACLGAILLDQRAMFDVSERLQTDDFYDPRHRQIFSSIVELVRTTEVIDIITLTNHLRNVKQLDRAGGVDYLNELLDMVPSATNVDYYVKIVREKAILRNLIYTAKGIVSQAMDESLDPKIIIDEAEKNIFEIAEREVREDFESARPILQRAVEKITHMMDTKKKFTGLPSGFPRLDAVTDGFHEAEFVIVAARPSMGKTAFVLNIASHLALNQKSGVAIFSLEMPKEQIILRLLSGYANIQANKIRKADFAQNEFDRIVEAADRLSDAPLFIDDTGGLTVFEVRAKLRRLMAQEKIHMVVIDYIQLMHHHAYKDNRQQQISEISRSLRALGKEMNIPVIALSQLNRKVDDRKDRQPQLSDLRESGAIEQDADLILFIHREEMYLKDKTPPEKKGKAEVIVGKNRNGPLDNIELAFDGKYTKFMDVDLYHGEEE